MTIAPSTARMEMLTDTGIVSGCILCPSGSSCSRSSMPSDILRGVRRGNERALELRRREKNSTVKHFTEEAGVTFGVGSFSAGVIADGLFAEEQRAGRAGGIDLAGDFCGDESLAQARSK